MTRARYRARRGVLPLLLAAFAAAVGGAAWWLRAGEPLPAAGDSAPPVVPAAFSPAVVPAAGPAASVAVGATPAVPAAGGQTVPPCSGAALLIERADGGRESACAGAPDSRLDGVVRLHRFAVHGPSLGTAGHLLEIRVNAGQVDSIRLLGEGARACAGEACAGASAGLADDEGAQPLQLAAVALGEGERCLRISGRLRGAPGPGCLGEGLLVSYSDGAAEAGGGGRYCPLGGAGDALLDDGRIEFHFADLDGHELWLTMAPDGLRVQAVDYAGRYRCEERACAAVTLLDGGPVLGRRLRFADLALAGESRLATLSGELALPPEETAGE